MFGFFGGRLLKTKVALMQSYEGVADSLSLLKLTLIFLTWNTNPCLSMTSLVCPNMRVKKTKSLVTSDLARFINSCCLPSW